MAENATPEITTAQGIGITLAICGNLAISAGLTMQKQVHNNNVGDAKVPYMKLPKWWIGLFLVVFGEAGNFLAYGYASATVVAPLGSVSVVSNAFLSHLYLKEPVVWREVVGLVLAVLGSVTVVLEAPHEESELTVEAFEQLLHQWPFLTFVPFVVISFVVIAVFVPQRFMDRYVLGYLSLCALSGSITVMCTKGVSTALVLTLAGNNQFFHPLPYILIIIACVSIFWNIRYLNMAMSRFGSSIVVPVYYVLFTFFAIAAGMVLLSDDLRGGANYAVFAAGIGVTVFGVFMITSASLKEKAAEMYDELDEDTVEMEMESENDIEMRISPLRTVPENESAKPRTSPNLQPLSTSPGRMRISGEFMAYSTPMLGALSVDLQRKWSQGEIQITPPKSSSKTRPRSMTVRSGSISSTDQVSISPSNHTQHDGRPRRALSLPTSPPARELEGVGLMAHESKI